MIDRTGVAREILGVAVMPLDADSRTFPELPISTQGHRPDAPDRPGAPTLRRHALRLALAARPELSLPPMRQDQHPPAYQDGASCCAVDEN